jgi:hypothetical protein
MRKHNIPRRKGLSERGKSKRSEIAKKIWNDEERRNTLSNESKKRFKQKSFREKHRKSMEKVYNNSEYIKKRKKIMSVVNKQTEKIASQRSTMKEGFASGRLTPWAKGLSVDTDERVKSIQEKNLGKEPWNIGLTKETHPSIMRGSIAISGENNPWFGMPKTEEMKRNLREKSKLRWKDFEYVKRVIKSRNLKPNKAEQILDDILQKHFPNQWKYVGDFSFPVDGKYPDFIHINGKKLIIELFGDYFHKGDDGSEKINHYAFHGYRTLIIMASELRYSDKIVTKVNQFIENKK